MTEHRSPVRLKNSWRAGEFPSARWMNQVSNLFNYMTGKNVKISLQPSGGLRLDAQAQGGGGFDMSLFAWGYVFSLPGTLRLYNCCFIAQQDDGVFVPGNPSYSTTPLTLTVSGGSKAAPLFVVAMIPKNSLGLSEDDIVVRSAPPNPQSATHWEFPISAWYRDEDTGVMKCKAIYQFGSPLSLNSAVL